MEQVYNILDHIRLHKILHYNKPNNKGQKMKKKKKTQLKLKKGRKKKEASSPQNNKITKPHKSPLSTSPRQKPHLSKYQQHTKNTKEKEKGKKQLEEKTTTTSSD